MKYLRNSLIVLSILGIGFSFGMANSEPIVTNAAYNNPASGARYYENPDQYYSGIDPNATGLELVEQLSTLTSSGFVAKGYKELPKIYQYSDLSNGKMRLMYTGSEVSFTPGSMPGGTNKEHVWPASWYGNGSRTTATGSPGADAHNIWPCATTLNSKRGSCAFDEFSFSSGYKCGEFTQSDFSYANPNDLNSYVWSSASGGGSDNFDALYPAKGHRGETARILMYVATRYHNNTTYPVMLHDKAETAKIGRIGKLSTLLKWHYEEPPTEWEINRNNEVASRWHHNRNPFVDHPEYATMIYSTLPEPDQSKPTQAVLDVISKYGKLEFADPVSISLTTKDITVTKNGLAKIEASVLPSDAKQSMKYLTSNPAVATVDEAGMVKGIGKGSCSITVSALENPAINAKVNVVVKELDSIAISGEPIKKVYDEGQKFDPKGLSVTATYSDGTSSPVNLNDCVFKDGVTGKDTLSFGTTFVTCIYNGKTVNYEGIVVNERVLAGYKYVSENLSDFSGDYLLVCEDTKSMLNGDAAYYSKSNSSIQSTVTIENGWIYGDYTAKDFTITKVGSDYKITSSSDKVIGGGKSSFGEDVNYVNSIKITDGIATIKCGNNFLRYNPDGSNFRYYSHSDVGYPVSLFKAESGSKPTPSITEKDKADALKFAQEFNAANVCGTNDNTKAISEIFLQQKAKFEALSEGAQSYLRTYKADQAGDEIAQCLARYDRIIYLHGKEGNSYPDFMHRANLLNLEGHSLNEVFNDSNIKQNIIFGALLIVAIGSLIGVSAVLIKKKQK